MSNPYTWDILALKGLHDFSSSFIPWGLCVDFFIHMTPRLLKALWNFIFFHFLVTMCGLVLLSNGSLA